MGIAPLEFRVVSPEWQQSLADFFQELASSPAAGHFHPHPLTAEHAAALVCHSGRDLYYLAVEGQRVLGYGMLRGWDEGYEVPSLGIALSADARGTGLARAFMLFLHAAARRRSAKQVRLKVHPDNTPARRLYESLGYRFAGEEKGQLVGLLDLT